jgi:arylsulfatase A-like enzyme
LPGGAARRALRIAEPVENLDIAPTVLAALGLAPESAFAGRNLLPLLRGAASAGGRATSAQGSLRALVEGGFKLVLDLESGQESLYDLGADPAERSDLSRQRPEELRRLRRSLADHLASTEGPRERSVAAGREAAERLRSLGYLQ